MLWGQLWEAPCNQLPASELGGTRDVPTPMGPHLSEAVGQLHREEGCSYIPDPFPLGNQPGSVPTPPGTTLPPLLLPNSAPLPARRALTSLWWDQSQRTASSRPFTWSMDLAAMASKCWAHSWQPKKCLT